MFRPSNMCITHNTAQPEKNEEKIPTKVGMISCTTDWVWSVYTAHVVVQSPTHRLVAGCLTKSEAQWKMQQAPSWSAGKWRLFLGHNLGRSLPIQNCSILRLFQDLRQPFSVMKSPTNKLTMYQIVQWIADPGLRLKKWRTGLHNLPIPLMG